MISTLKQLIWKIIPLSLRIWVRKDRESLLRFYLSSNSDRYETKQYGNEYGGFLVYDKHLKNQSGLVVYSFGIGEDLSFSKALMDSLTPDIYAYDPTPRSITYVKQHQLSKNEHFHFSSFGLSDKDEITTFYLPVNETWVSGSAEHGEHLKKIGIDVEMKCLDTFTKENKHQRIDLLKMDIEGSEFKVIEKIDFENIHIGQICIEIHDRFFKDGYKKLRHLLKKMKQNHYRLIAISSSLEELTFVLC